MIAVTVARAFLEPASDGCWPEQTLYVKGDNNKTYLNAYCSASTHSKIVVGISF